jgi:hypothetical protein
VRHAHALFLPHSYLNPLIINIRHNHPHTRALRLLSPNAPPPLVNQWEVGFSFCNSAHGVHIVFSVESSINSGNVTLVGIDSLVCCVVVPRCIQLAGVDRILGGREFLIWILMKFVQQHRCNYKEPQHARLHGPFGGLQTQQVPVTSTRVNIVDGIHGTPQRFLSGGLGLGQRCTDHVIYFSLRHHP